MALIMNVLTRLIVVPNMPILRKNPFSGFVFIPDGSHFTLYQPTGINQYGTLAIFRS
jgi:hypothetical protein